MDDQSWAAATEFGPTGPKYLKPLGGLVVDTFPLILSACCCWDQWQKVNLIKCWTTPSSKVSHSCCKWYNAVYLLCLKGPILKTFLGLDVYLLCFVFIWTWFKLVHFIEIQNLFFNREIPDIPQRYNKKQSQTSASRSWASLFGLSPLDLPAASEALLVLQHWLEQTDMKWPWRVGPSPRKGVWRYSCPLWHHRGQISESFRCRFQKLFLSCTFFERKKQNKESNNATFFIALNNNNQHTFVMSVFNNMGSFRTRKFSHCNLCHSSQPSDALLFAHYGVST